MALGLYGGALYDEALYDGSGSSSSRNPINSLIVQTRTLLQGAVLAMPLSTPSPAPLRVTPATATLLRVVVHTEPGTA